MTFWSEKSWRKTQISLVRYVSLTWQSTAWRADQMLSFLNLLRFGASCCCLLLLAMCCLQILLSHLNMFFPNVPHAITKNSQKITSVGSSMLSNTWCWAFVVTLRAAEWITSSVGSFMCLQMAWCWTFFVTGSSWMVHHQCGFFRVSLNGLILNSCSHTGSNWMIYHCCGSFQVSSKCLMLNILSHSESSWMVYHQCGLFHVSSNGLILNIWSATRSKWMFFHWCELFHVSSMPDVKEWEQLNGVSPLWVLSCASSKSIHVFCLPCWKLNWHTGIKCCS